MRIERGGVAVAKYVADAKTIRSVHETVPVEGGDYQSVVIVSDHARYTDAAWEELCLSCPRDGQGITDTSTMDRHPLDGALCVVESKTETDVTVVFRMVDQDDIRDTLPVDRVTFIGFVPRAYAGE